MIRKSGNLPGRNDGKLPVKVTCLSKIPRTYFVLNICFLKAGVFFRRNAGIRQKLFCQAQDKTG